ncbi:hypothetical protein BGX26_005463, partial [Mortierella sp. AD094]
MTSAASTLNLCCVLEDDWSSNAFPIEDMPSGMTVGKLKTAIWNDKKALLENENAKDASQLKLWRVTIPTGKGVPDTLTKVGSVEGKELLMGGATLSGYFKDGAPENTIHIIVEQPK